ncbi:hypothetical protein DERF_004774 [Dermatophagoides farinae]|uniref:Uncharacterized protein n=1 Tax=Dermatophagoides farinae TaxID=6954 RepID=A0A922I4L4_DERFA|nr:hypothetical protein DERF_004774 [Dermatophagoides farinae]
MKSLFSTSSTTTSMCLHLIDSIFLKQCLFFLHGIHGMFNIRTFREIKLNLTAAKYMATVFK